MLLYVRLWAGSSAAERSVRNEEARGANPLQSITSITLLKIFNTDLYSLLYKGSQRNMATKGMEKYGHWLFLLGVVLAVVLGFAMPNAGWAVGMLAVLGLIVGLVNITATEVKDFLIASIALIVAAGSFALLPVVGTYVANIMKYLLAMVAPAATIVALVQIWKLAKSK